MVDRAASGFLTLSSGGYSFAPAQAVNDDGLPGTQILTLNIDEMRTAKQPLARHWDRD